MRDKLIYNSPESRITISNTFTHTHRGNRVQCKYPAVFSLLLIFVNDSASAAPAVSVALSVYMSLSLFLLVYLSLFLSALSLIINIHEQKINVWLHVVYVLNAFLLAYF